MENKPQNKKLLFIVIILFAILVAGIFLVFPLAYLFIAQPHKISGNAMAPTLQDGQYFLSKKIASKDSIRGDIIVFKSPIDKSQDFIKRIVGLPGENIKIQDCRVYIDEQVLNEQYLAFSACTRNGNFLYDGEAKTIPENSYFVIGDNRDHSSDSREWGFVPKENIIGKFWFRYF